MVLYPSNPSAISYISMLTHTNFSNYYINIWEIFYSLHLIFFSLEVLNEIFVLDMFLFFLFLKCKVMGLILTFCFLADCWKRSGFIATPFQCWSWRFERKWSKSSTFTRHNRSSSSFGYIWFSSNEAEENKSEKRKRYAVHLIFSSKYLRKA